MKKAPISDGEAARLAALHRYAILDTPAEEEFDDFTRLAAQICGTPIALISLVDAERQWFKSTRGLSAPETPRDISFCGHAIHGKEIFEVSNALEDERFRDNPLVTSDPNIRFYAGAPLVTPDGYGVGTLCVIDTAPHRLDAAQRESLAALSRQVVRLLELRIALRQAKDMTAKAQESEERFHQLFLHMGQGVVIQEADGRIADANPAAERILGLSLAQMRGISSLDLRWRAIHEDGAEFPGSEHPAMSALRSGAPVTGVVMGIFHPGDDDWRWLRVDAYPRHHPDSGAIQQVYSVFSDITETRSAFLEVREARRFLSDLLAAASELSIIATNREGLITTFNLGAERLLGYTAAEMVGKQTPAIIHVAAEIAARGRELSAELGRPIEGFRVFVELPEWHGSEKREWTYVRKDGQTVPVSLVATTMRDDSGEIVGYLGIAEDITERKRAADAIRDQTQRIQTILDNVIDGIITIDDRGIVASLNAAAERIFGFSPSEVLGQNIKMLMPEPYHSQHDGYLANYRATGVERVIGIGREVVGRRKNGATFPMDLAVSEIRHGGKRMFVGLVRDITERKRVEKMKSEFVSTVSHELRTPLTSISGALGLIVGGALGDLPAIMQPMIEIAHKNSLRLAHLINDLLDMEKLAAGMMRFDFQIHSLMPLVEQAIESNRAYAEQFKVSYALTRRADEAQVRVDSARLQQVLTNLLSNAAKFSPPGEAVTIEVVRHGRAVRATVSDHGPGIPEEFRARIFQKFSQADSSDTRQKGGTGLGLAISKELIESMNGLVGFDSKEGEGARFHFELPLWQPQAMTARSSEKTSNAPYLLVVEDEPDIAELLKILLSNEGYRVDIAYDGETAMKLLMERDYAAMTLDLMLPDCSGVNLIRRVRSQSKTEQLPIIVVSAYTDDGRLAIGGEFNATDWLEKPLQEPQLLAALRHAMAGQPTDTLRVLLVENDIGLQRNLRSLLGDRAEFDLACSLSEARLKLTQHRYPVVVLNMRLPDGSGWELLSQSHSPHPAPAVIVLSDQGMIPTQQEDRQFTLVDPGHSSQDLLRLLDRLLGSKIR